MWLSKSVIYLFSMQFTFDNFNGMSKCSKSAQEEEARCYKFSFSF